MRRRSAKARSRVGARALFACVAALAIILAGCSSPEQGNHQPTTAASVKEPAVIYSYYAQKLHWKRCQHLECATVSVPLDWAHPTGSEISLAVAKRAATDGHPLGSIFYDPGGPGASGTYFLESYPNDIVDKKVGAAYNVVGFDSRGVGSSTAINCLDQKQLSHYLFDVVPGTVGSTRWVAAELKAQTAFDKACQKRTGELIGHMDTVSAARDLDVLRAVLGQKKLDYFGVSYGTKLGLEYAELFPKKVGRLVLDGVDDPDLTGEQSLVQQSAGVEDVLQRYLASCLQDQSSCPFTGTVADADNQLTALFSQVQAHPISDADGRRLNAYNLALAIIDSLYSTTYWSDLNDALHAASVGLAGPAFQLADSGNEREPNGDYPNLYEAYDANLCDDFVVAHTPSTMAAEAATIDKVAPVLGPYLGYQGAVCTAWPYKPTGKPVRVEAQGAGPILLLSSTHDPATPLIWAQHAAEDLASGQLVTRNGDGHGSYNIGNACIDIAVDAYFLHGTVPATDPKC